MEWGQVLNEMVCHLWDHVARFHREAHLSHSLLVQASQHTSAKVGIWLQGYQSRLTHCSLRCSLGQPKTRPCWPTSLEQLQTSDTVQSNQRIIEEYCYSPFGRPDLRIDMNLDRRPQLLHFCQSGRPSALCLDLVFHTILILHM